jgi:hypothetical protein
MQANSSNRLPLSILSKPEARPFCKKISDRELRLHEHCLELRDIGKISLADRFFRLSKTFPRLLLCGPVISSPFSTRHAAFPICWDDP